jgi:hypothetical protein
MRILSRFLLLIFFLLTTSQIFSYLYLQATAPRKPDISIGAIYLRHMQGDTVYLTKAQSYYCNDEILNIAVFCGLPAIFYEVWAQQKRAENQREDLRQD